VSLYKGAEIRAHREEYVREALKTVRSKVQKPLLTSAFDGLCHLWPRKPVVQGVCISAKGYILTCVTVWTMNMISGCCGSQKVIIVTSGLVCLSECVAVDFARDCALLKCLGTYDNDGNVSKDSREYPFARLSSTLPTVNE